ncbi:MAG TPA: VWA domain-containing protein [Blastocatellia bacterium]|nr:VWA domain-containing protein [Blastocatellia bacterium]
MQLRAVSKQQRFLKPALILLALSLLTFSVIAQSKKAGGAGRRIVTLNVIAHAPDGRLITKDDLNLYDGGVHQEIETFSRLDSGSKIVLLVDDSANLKAEPPALQKAMEAVINELYSDDEMMVVAYNESAEILEDMTPDLAKLQATPKKLLRKGFPNLYDALVAVADALSNQAKTGFEKRAIILISDGYDSESKTKFDSALEALQEENIVLYAIQVPDRTRGALLKDKPKPPVSLEKLTAGTGGTILPFDKAEESAKTIADDLRKNWYRLVYSPSNVNTINLRRLLIVPARDGLELRTKSSIPGTFK